MIRMVDMPIDQIRKVLDGDLELGAAAEKQKEEWVITISTVVMAGVSTFLFCFFHYNEKQI